MHLLELRRQGQGLPLALLVARGELPLVHRLRRRRRARRARDGVVVHADYSGSGGGVLITCGVRFG